MTKLDSPPCRTYTVYLIRHGEAIHNVVEKQAQNEAAQLCCKRGLSCDDNETLQAMEEARKGVLRDPSFFDAAITELGRKEARSARIILTEYVKEGLPSPQEVLTSPLQRCLGTVEELFPDKCVDVRVEEDLRERLTGRPADNRYSSDVLEKRFPRFDFERLRSLSQANLSSECLSAAETDVSDAISASGMGDDFIDESRMVGHEITMVPQFPVSFRLRTYSSLNADVELEDESCVQRRSLQVFKMLEESRSDSIAIVTHKGFLRALERGCFGISDSKEFKNCEVRVYRIQLTPGNNFPGWLERLR